MTLKAKLPSFEKGSANLGDQLRELLAVVGELCDAAERLEEALTAKSIETTADEVVEDKQEAPEAVSDEPAEAEAPAATKPASKPATRASAK